MQRIHVPNAYGPLVVRMTAWRGRGIAITRSAEDTRRWSITHIQSGRRVTSISPNLPLRKARRIAALLAASVDWMAFPPDPWNLPPTEVAEMTAFTDVVAEMFEAAP